VKEISCVSLYVLKTGISGSCLLITEDRASHNRKPPLSSNNRFVRFLPKTDRSTGAKGKEYNQYRQGGFRWKRQGVKASRFVNLKRQIRRKSKRCKRPHLRGFLWKLREETGSRCRKQP
jgi:hypothetical protein